MKKGIKADEVAISKSPQPIQQKLLQKKERKSKQIDQIDKLDERNGTAKDQERDHNDSFEKFYNKDLDLEEDQVPVVIYELCESAINFISQESYEKGLILLQKALTMLEQIQAKKNPHDQFVFLLIMHNMSLCYQKLGVLDECANCLEKCLQYLNSEVIQQFFNDPYQPSLKLKLLKYRCKTHMQVCALYSQIHKHRDAAHHANEAIQISHYLMHDAENMCAHFTKELIQQKPLAEVSIIGNLQFGLLQKTAVKLLPIFQAILKKVALEDECEPEEQGVPLTGPLPKNHHSLGKKLDKKVVIKIAQEKSNSRIGSGNMNLDVGEPDMKNLLGYLNQNEWIYSLNIGNIMQVAPLTLQDFLSTNSLSVELTREYVLEKICFLCVSYFCLGTEFRFLHQQNEIIQGVSFQRKDSEYFHGKAVELAISFLPSESPLVSHVLMSYEKHHSPSNLPIPEDSSQDVKVRVVRQISGIDSNKLQPIIRFHPETDYRVKFIAIKPLDYFEINSSRVRDSRRNRNQDIVRQTSLSLGRQNTGTRRSIQFQVASNQTSSKQSNVQDKIFKQANKNDDQISENGKIIDDVDIVEDTFSKQALTGVMSPASDELTQAAGFMKMEDQRAMSLKKSQKKGATHIYNTLNRTGEIVVDREALGSQQQRLAQTASHLDAEITEKDKQRMSEVGISQKHRRLQTSELQKIIVGQRAAEHSSQIDLPREQNTLELAVSSINDQQRNLQERRARSSLSNRHIGQKQQMQGPTDVVVSDEFQPLEGTLSQNLLAFNANQQRLTIQNQDAAKNQRLIVEQLEESHKTSSLQVHRQNSAKRRHDDQEKAKDQDDLLDIHNQIRNSRTELGHHQRSSTLQTTTDFQHKRQQHLMQNANIQGSSSGGKVGAPITDIRAKPVQNQVVSSTTNIQSNHLEDLTMPLNEMNNRQSASLVPNLQQQQNVNRTKKGISTDNKANIASHLNQQMLLQHMMQQPQAVQIQQQQQSGSRSSQNQLSNLYVQQQLLSATQKINTTNAVTAIGQQTNVVNVGGSNKQRRAGNSGGSQKKQSINNKGNSGQIQQQIGNNSVLTNEQLIFMMQQKRDRLNQSQLVNSHKHNEVQHDDLVQINVQAQGNQNLIQQQNSQMPPSAAGHIVNLNKLYASHRKTPTNLSTTSAIVNEQLQNKYAQQQQVKSVSSNSAVGNGGVITSKATPQVKTTLLVSQQDQQKIAARASSQLAHHSSSTGQVTYFENGEVQKNSATQQQQGVQPTQFQSQYNRKSSIEGRMGMAYATTTPSSSMGTVALSSGAQQSNDLGTQQSQKPHSQPVGIKNIRK